MSGDYTFDKMLVNLQAIADQMSEEAMNVNAGARVVAAALDATIENLLWLIRGASISWVTAPKPDEFAWLVANSEGVVGLQADGGVMPWDEVLKLYFSKAEA